MYWQIELRPAGSHAAWEHRFYLTEAYAARKRDQLVSEGYEVTLPRPVTKETFRLYQDR